MLEIRSGNFTRRRAKKFRDQLVGYERMLGRDDLAARLQKGMPDEFDDFVRSVAEDQLVRRNAELLRKRLAHIIAAAVRIKMRTLQRGLHGRPRFRRRAERVLVRSELDDAGCLRADLARGFFDRLTRLVDGEVAQLRVGEIPDGRH